MEWIDVNLSKPKESETVLVLVNNQGKKRIELAHVFLLGWFCSCECREKNDVFNITHWMELPEAPKE